MNYNKDLTVGEYTGPITHKYVMKVYKIRIVSFQMGGIWYANKVGNEYYTILAAKGNNSPVFRLVDVNDALTMIQPKSLILDVYPSNCEVVSEFIVRSVRDIKHIRI